jgi:hypothetical protein
MDHTLDFEAILKGSVENEVFREITDPPHADVGKLANRPVAAHSRCLCEFGEGTPGSIPESAGDLNASVLPDVSKMVNEIAAGGRPYHNSGHPGSSPLALLNQRKSMALDFLPVPVTHLRRFSAGLSLLEKRIDAAVPALIYRDRLSVASCEKKLSRLIEELIAVGELAAGDAFSDKFLDLCGQDNVHGSFLHKSYLAFYLLADGMSSMFSRHCLPATLPVRNCFEKREFRGKLT